MSNSDHNARQRPGSRPPVPDTKAMPPSSWAKRTGFKPKFSGETNASDSGQISLPPKPREAKAQLDLEAGRVRAPPAANGEPGVEKVVPSSNKEPAVKKPRDSNGMPKSTVLNTNRQATATPADQQSGPRRTRRHEEVIDVLPQTADDNGFVSRHSRMKYELRDSPGLGKRCLCLFLKIANLITYHDLKL